MIEHFNALPNNYALLNGRYQLLEVLGSGGFGITYLCFDKYLEKKVAVKEYMPSDFAVRQQGTTVLPKTSGEDKNNFNWGLKAFLQEARTLARFKHPQIIQVENFFEENQTAYLVMEYAQGQTLDNYLVKHHSMNEDELKTLLLLLIDGLKKVHEVGIFHRDIKPTNIIIRDNGSPVLIDFGAARQNIGSKSRPITTLITPGYAPMEQYDSSAQLLGAWTDIYALGALAFHCLTGKQPVDSPNRVMQRDPDADPITLELNQWTHKISPDFLHALLTSLAIYAEQRPQNLQQWSALLQPEKITPPKPPKTVISEPPPQVSIIQEPESPLLSSINHLHTARPQQGEVIHDRSAKTQVSNSTIENAPIPDLIIAVYKKYLYISVIWLVTIPLLCFLFAGLIDGQKGIPIVFIIMLVSSGMIMFLRHKRLAELAFNIGEDDFAKQQYLGCERANYWLGLSIVNILFLSFLFDKFNIEWFGFYGDDTGGVFAILLSVICAGVILRRYKTHLLGTEIALYWLGISINISLLFAVIFDENNINWFNIDEFENGLFLGLLLSLFSGSFLLFKRRERLCGMEIALYWLGLNINLISIMLIFFIDRHKFVLFLSLILSFATAIILLIIRRKQLTGSELTLYWIGLNIDALMLIIFSENLYILFISLLASITSGSFLFWKYKKIRLLT